MEKRTIVIVVTLLLGITYLFLEYFSSELNISVVILHGIDAMILLLLILELIIHVRIRVVTRRYLRDNWFSFSFLVLFSLVFLYNVYVYLKGYESRYLIYPAVFICIRNMSLLFRFFYRFKRISSIIESLSVHPAQTILISFLAVILLGAIVLTMPFTTVNNHGLSFPNALFTATSAVCVTGLIVVDTATYFTLWGKIIVLVLIQIGGLGIMILSYFTLFVLRRGVSVKDKFLLSYVLSQTDMRTLSKTVVSIIYITLVVEGAGAVLLFFGFKENTGITLVTLFHAVFHSVSAFCNAGFALFSDSLEQFYDNAIVTLTVAVLIVIGGISFAVIVNVKEVFAATVKTWVTGVRRKIPAVTLNTKSILIGTAILLVSGMLVFYALEHRHTLRSYALGPQYLSALFQSVTLRTAGFNTVPFGGLSVTTYLVMVLFMFIGAASGSTAGGIKINSVTVMGSYIYSLLRNRSEVTIAHHSIPTEQVLKAFLILLFGIAAVFIGVLVLSITETAELPFLLFECVSAFGTVGLSAGITPGLSLAGKIMIIILMFIGRVGPLTILAAASTREKKIQISYPVADIAIG